MSHINTAIAIATILFLFIGMGSATNIPENTIYEEKPLGASFTYSPVNPQAGDTVAFTTTATGSNITCWAWVFGDECSASVQNPTHSYATAGTFTVTLTITDATGATDTATDTVTVTSAAAVPVASFTYSPTTINPGTQVAFTDQSTNSPTSWSWSFGDGGMSMAQNPLHTYTSAGTYTVCLTVSNAAGSDTYCRSITVFNPLDAGFSYSPTCPNVDESVIFTDQSQGNPYNWEWNFDDGTVSYSQNPSHTYSSAGEYDVTLTVSKSGTTSDSVTKTITVSEGIPKPDADFIWLPTCPDVGETIYFTNTSTGEGIDQWSWDFDDAMDFTGKRYSTLQNPSHTYEYAGSYYVTLTVWNDAGSDIVGKTITISPPPTPTPSPYSLSLNEGWNLASIPLKNATYTVPAPVYPHVYAYDSVSQKYCDMDISDMQAGTGYWIASASDVSMELYGEPVSHYSCNGTKGWNMIGGLAYETTSQGITLDSMSISNPILYGYDGISRKYQSFGYLLPSYGYWLYLYEDGIVNVTMAPPPSP